MPFLSHAGVSLRYDRAGAGPAVLLVHGWTGNRTWWERQLVGLRDRHTVVAVDLRGHGESSHPRTGYGLGALVGDLEHLVRALAVPRIAVVGSSMGGMLALELALRLGERASALVLVGSSPGGLTDKRNPRAQVERTAEMRAAIAADFRGFVRGFAPTLFKLGAASPLLPWAIAQMQKTPAHAALACFETAVAFDARARLKDVAVPTAVFHGRHDTLFPLADAEELVKKVRGARLMVFEESAHVPFVEEPEAFNAAVAAVLGGS